MDVEVLVVGAGQAGLSAARHLQRAGFAPEEFRILDHDRGPGGAWQHRWASLTLGTTNHVADLPDLRLASDQDEVPARTVVPEYFAEYERHFGLDVQRPVTVSSVRSEGERLVVGSDAGTWTARALLNATGSWERPFWPRYPGADDFRGRQLHTADYVSAEEFRGQHVVVVGAGISAVQLLDEVSRVTTTTWVTRREPEFHETRFTAEDGRAAVARVEERVRAGLPPGSIVSVTGLPLTPVLRAARERGVLERRPMFARLLPEGVAWADGTVQRADVVLWCTGFRSALDHLAPLGLREPGGGITMTGRLATQVARDPRVHLLGYGPSASTVGANRAGRAAVREVSELLAR
ncbi:NAD(P)-binding domain-containing protein [Rhodococcus aerolatus]